MRAHIKRQFGETHKETSLKYSKSSDFYLGTKKDFFTENDNLLEKSLKQNLLYAEQPLRKKCKICEFPLGGDVDLSSHGIGYIFCESCSHLNGIFEDTQEFIEGLYISDSGANYSSNYIDHEFIKRASDIYIPKIDFLIDNIPSGFDYRILDVGCGSGYFVYAALLKGLVANGLDVNQTMVDFGNQQIKHLMDRAPLIFEDENGFYEAIIKSNANVISAIGVIEHLRDPHRFFDAFIKSDAKYLYYSVPMFSFAVLLENVFKETFPRQLSGGHTHLFTEQSVKKMNQIIGVKSIAEWRFGTDAMDLYRHILIGLTKHKSSKKILDSLDYGFQKNADYIQQIFDQNHFCSEIHCVVSKDS